MKTSMMVCCAVILVAAVVRAEDDPVAELAALGDAMAASGPEGGGSIRAKREADPAALNRLKDPKNLEGKVELIQIGKFPAVALKVKVLTPAKEGGGKDIAKNSVLVLVPRLKVDAGRIDMRDPPTVLNMGSFYLQDGDRVAVRLGSKKGNVWEAEYIERR